MRASHWTLTSEDSSTVGNTCCEAAGKHSWFLSYSTDPGSRWAHVWFGCALSQSWSANLKQDSYFVYNKHIQLSHLPVIWTLTSSVCNPVGSPLIPTPKEPAGISFKYPHLHLTFWYSFSWPSYLKSTFQVLVNKSQLCLTLACPEILFSVKAKDSLLPELRSLKGQGIPCR